jgi:hypothetical protein
MRPRPWATARRIVVTADAVEDTLRRMSVGSAADNDAADKE